MRFPSRELVAQAARMCVLAALLWSANCSRPTVGRFGDHDFHKLIAARKLGEYNLEITALNTLAPTIPSWKITPVSPCDWAGITCSSDNHVTQISLSSSSLSGWIGPTIAYLSHLQSLDLSSNNFSGPISPAIGSLSSLTLLDLSRNHFSGRIPSSMGNLSSLLVINLGNNKLSGPIPVSLQSLKSLKSLNFTNNNLTGPVPTTSPLGSFTYASFLGNPLLCRDSPDFPLHCSTNYSAPLPPPSATPSLDTGAPSPTSKSSSSSSMAIIISCAVAAVLALSLLLAAFFFWRRRKSAKGELPPDAQSLKGVSGSEVDMANPAFQNLKLFQLSEIVRATNNFSSKNKLGEGGFGQVYRAEMADGSVVAVKRLKTHGSSSQHEQDQFMAEIGIINRAAHRNLLRLLGYCSHGRERLLVYPLMPNGSVLSHLRGSNGKYQSSPLPWSVRKRIAIGTAEALAYMHHSCEPRIIHRDVKSANVLLSETFDPVVCDFGLAKLLNFDQSQVETAVRGTKGHIAPEYMRTGKTSEKTDVYGYGIFLMELLTGKSGVGLALMMGGKDVLLRDWVLALLKEGNVKQILDPDLNLEEEPNAEAAAEDSQHLLQLALLCIDIDPRQRPAMSECVSLLQGSGLQERWDRWKVEEATRYRDYEKEQQLLQEFKRFGLHGATKSSVVETTTVSSTSKEDAGEGTTEAQSAREENASQTESSSSKFHTAPSGFHES